MLLIKAFFRYLSRDLNFFFFPFHLHLAQLNKTKLGKCSQPGFKTVHKSNPILTCCYFLTSMSGENNSSCYKMMLLLESNKTIAQNEANQSNSSEDNGEENSSVELSHEFMDELELDIKVGEEYFDDLNKWFDKFDAAISIPNDGFIKYEITNDGLILLLVNQERENLVEEIRKYVAENCSSQVPDA